MSASIEESPARGLSAAEFPPRGPGVHPVGPESEPPRAIIVPLWAGVSLPPQSLTRYPYLRIG